MSRIRSSFGPLLDWYSIGGANQASITAHVVERVAALRSKPALLAWLLGNEVGGHALQTRGEAPIVAGLRDLYTTLPVTMVCIRVSSSIRCSTAPSGAHLTHS